MSLYYQFWYHAAWLVMRICHPIRTIGRDHIPDGAAVVCPNHSCLNDPVLCCLAFTHRHQLHPLAKAEVHSVPILGKLLEWGGVIFVDRGTADIKAVKASLSVLKKGGKLLIFPEGTRIRNGVDKHGAPSDPKTGAALFAARGGAPLIPVYIPEKKRWFRRTTIVIGEAYHPEFEGRKPTTDELQAITDDLMVRIRQLKEQAL